MSKHIIEDPDDTGRKRISDGRLWLGKEYSGKKVEYAVKVIEEDNNE